MLVSFGMDVPSMVEDILSDEYEEGEILDDDILYENVSSSEEFSDVEDRKGQKGVKPEAKKVKSKRRKEHKCKMDSLCRVERSGKHCYARIRKRRNSLELKSAKNSICGNLDDSERKQRPQSAKSISPNRGFKRDTFNKESAKSKGNSGVRKRGLPYYFQHDNRSQPPAKAVPDRRCKKNRRLSTEDHRNSYRKRKSRSPSPKRKIETNRSVTKSSLLERLVGSGSIPMKIQANETDTKPADSEDHADLEPDPNITEPNLFSNCDVKDVTQELCPADIPVPPTPRALSPEPPKQEIEELHLRLHALKTAIIKKHTDLKRKKRLASSKKRDSVEDSFTEFAMQGLLDDECESIPTPPPPGTDWPPASLDDNRWSDEDMVIDQESICGDVMIESNIPASDPSLQSFDYPAVSSPPSHDTLPCCRGNPIPVVTHNRPLREEPELKPPSSVIPLVYDSEEPASGSRMPKYLKEINSNKLMRRRRRSQGIHGKNNRSLGWHPRKRRNSIRQVPKPMMKSFQPKERPKVLKDDDDEDELRKLALMSVKPKSTITGGMLTAVRADLNPLSINTDQTTEKIQSPAKHQSPAEPWDDLDEDILRAQLLSSLSRNIPTAQPNIPKQPSPTVVKKQILTKKINKENLYTRRNTVANAPVSKPQKKNPAKFVNPNVKSNLTAPHNPPPKVGKFIIKVSDSESSEDEAKGKPQRKSEIELSIDRLLAETRKETELIQKASQFYLDMNVVESDNKQMPCDSVIEEPPGSLATLTTETALLISKEKIDECLPSPKFTHSEGLSHLPAWQQEEFQRQKRIMAYKGSLIEAAKQKIRVKAEPQKAPAEDTKSIKIVRKSLASAAKSVVQIVPDGSESASLITAAEEKRELQETSAEGIKSLTVVEKALQSADSKSVVKTVPDGSESAGLSTANEEKRERQKTSAEGIKSLEIVQESLKSADSGSVVQPLSDGPATSSDSTHKAIQVPVADSLSPVFATKDSDESVTAITCETRDESESDNFVDSEVQNLVEELLIRVSSCTVPTTTVCKSVASLSTISSNSGESRDQLIDVKPSRNQIKSESEMKLIEPSQNSALVANMPKTNISSTSLSVLKPQLRNSSAASVVKSAPIPVKAIQRTLLKKSLQNPDIPKKIAPSNATKSSISNTVAQSSKLISSNGLVEKPPFIFKDSSYATKALNEMVEMVTGFENGISEYERLKRDYIALRKQLAMAQQKMSKKRQDLLDMKGKLENKKRLLDSTLTMDTSSLSPLPDNREQPKPSSRDSELFSLRYKEVCLKAHLAMMGLQTPNKPAAKPAVKLSAPTAVKNSRPLENAVVSPRKRLRLRPRPVEKLRALPVGKQLVKPVQPVQTASNSAVPKNRTELPSSSKKLVISVHDKDMDPLIPLCPYDLTGVCKDEECKYQHLRIE